MRQATRLPNEHQLQCSSWMMPLHVLNSNEHPGEDEVTCYHHYLDLCTFTCITIIKYCVCVCVRVCVCVCACDIPGKKGGSSRVHPESKYSSDRYLSEGFAVVGSPLPVQYNSCSLPGSTEHRYWLSHAQISSSNYRGCG